MKQIFKFGVALAAFCFAGSALACPDPNWRAHQSIGTISLGADRSQSPVIMTAGGTSDLSQCAFLGPRATGVTTVGAGIRFRLNNRRRERLYIEASGVNCDLVMVMNDARGRWYFADDSRQISIDLTLLQAPSGVYNLWLGVTGPSACPTTVRIRLGERQGYGGAVGGGEGQSGGGGNIGQGGSGGTPRCPAAGLPPRTDLGLYGFNNARNGARAFIQRAGGTANLANCAFSGVSASGYSTYTPSFSFNWVDNETTNMLLETVAPCDTTLLVRAPNGLWGFNDNTRGANAALAVPRAPRGRYDVWIGTAQSVTCRAELRIWGLQ